MIHVLGFELDRAIACLQAAGYQVTLGVVSCRKGVDGNERRVVRQMELPAGEDGVPRVELTWATFCTALHLE